MNWKNQVMRLLFPEKCAACGKLLPEGGVLCEACAASIAMYREGLGRPAHSEGLSGVAACYRYEGAAEKLLQSFKFRHRMDSYHLGLRPAFEERMAEEFAEIPLDVVVPVPMIASARSQRGFNQSEIIAEGLAKYLRLPCDCTSLRKIRHNRLQHELSAAERSINVKNTYRVRGDAFVRKSVLLVDDVVTTGATLSACAVALREAGAVKVYGAAVLHVG